MKLHSHKSSKIISSPGEENDIKARARRKRVKKEHSVEVESSNVDDSKMEENKMQ